MKQATNTYRLSLPERARQFLGWRGLPAPLPEDCEHAREVRAAELETWQKSLSLEERALFALGDSSLGQALAQLGKAIERESARRAESRSDSIKPAPD